MNKTLDAAGASARVTSEIAPVSVLAFEAHVGVGPPVQVGKVQGGQLRIVTLTGGSFEGPEIRGKIGRLQVSNTYSHSLGTGSSWTGAEGSNNGYNQNPFNMHAAYSNSSFDIRQALRVNGLYALPPCQ